MKALLEFDEISIVKNPKHSENYNYLKEYVEPKIFFLPTFNDTLNKSHPPSWYFFIFELLFKKVTKWILF